MQQCHGLEGAQEPRIFRPFFSLVRRLKVKVPERRKGFFGQPRRRFLWIVELVSENASAYAVHHDRLACVYSKMGLGQGVRISVSFNANIMIDRISDLGHGHDDMREPRAYSMNTKELGD
jgi:hypothetical protein